MVSTALRRGKATASAGACHACGERVDVEDRVGRRATCPSCGGDLHCCSNCEFYDPGTYNECREPQAERVLDKGRANFCDCFRFRRLAAEGPATPPPGSTGAARAALDALFRRQH